MPAVTHGAQPTRPVRSRSYSEVRFGHDPNWKRRYRQADALFTVNWAVAGGDPPTSSAWMNRRYHIANAAMMRASTELTHAFASQFRSRDDYDAWYDQWRKHGTPPATALMDEAAAGASLPAATIILGVVRRLFDRGAGCDEKRRDRVLKIIGAVLCLLLGFSVGRLPHDKPPAELSVTRLALPRPSAPLSPAPP